MKYLFKYVYKGHDCANLVIQENALIHDEIKTFMDSRYVSAPEAAWRLFGFNMHENSHIIIRLPVHLSNEQHVYFNEHNILQRMQQAAEKDTQLTAWFKNMTLLERYCSLIFLNITYLTKNTQEMESVTTRSRKNNCQNVFC